MSLFKGILSCGLLIPCVVTDIRKKQVPVWYLLGAGVVGAVFSFIAADVPWWSVLLGILTGGVFLLLSKLTRGAIGYGDGAMIAFLGAWLGLGTSVSALLLGLFIAALAGGICLLLKKGRRYQLPFAPFLAVGLITVVVSSALMGEMT